MAGPLTIQRFPKGLLGLLDMKGSGQTPPDLSSIVQPQIDVSALYMADARRSLGGGAGPNVLLGFAFNNGSKVPEGEMWVVNNITVTVTTGGAVTGEYAAGYQDNGSNSFVVSPYMTVPISQTVVGIGVQFAPWSLVLMPGYKVGIWGKNLTGLTTSQIWVDYYRVPL